MTTSRRIPPVDHTRAGPAEIVDAILARRGGTLMNIDRQMLHSPELARGWNHMLGAVRTRLALPGRLRELAICAVATLNGASYEFHHHAPVLLHEGGSAAQVEALRDVIAALRAEAVFDRAERAVLQLTLEMTRSVSVSDATFTELRQVLNSDQHVVELVAVVAAYNMVSRFIVALQIDPE